MINQCSDKLLIPPYYKFYARNSTFLIANYKNSVTTLLDMLNSRLIGIPIQRVTSRQEYIYKKKKEKKKIQNDKESVLSYDCNKKIFLLFRIEIRNAGTMTTDLSMVNKCEPAN